jgi:glycosyltransferase involved in cell wall biosynthesis
LPVSCSLDVKKEPEAIEQSRTASEKNKYDFKVLQGVWDIANQMATIAHGLTDLGVIAKTLCYHPNYLKYKSDFIINIDGIRDPNLALMQTRKVAEQLIPQFDIFHFHFGSTLTLDYSDLPALKKLGKKAVTHYWGSDVRMYSKAIGINPYVKVKQTNENVLKHWLDKMANYVSHCIVGDYELHLYVKDFFDQVQVIPAVIDISQYQPRTDDRKNDKFLIVHAPTSPGIKGSKFIIEAIEKLKPKYDFEFRLIQGTSHEEAKKIYQQADLIVDELHCGSYGLLTIETMAMAKPVITWICDYMQEKYPSELPVISANQDTVKDKIEYALNNRELLPELGIRGRQYVEKYHDMNKVVPQIAELYQRL